MIYSVVVSGKTAKFADQATDRLFKLLDGPTPFQYLAKLHLDDITQLCKTARVGAYAKNARFLWEVSRNPPDLRNCTPANLEKYHGVGMKTSRFFIVWTRPDARYAVLDTHILRWLHQRGVWVPSRTPRCGDYERIERTFIKIADSLGLTPRQLDWKIWSEGSGYKGDIQHGPEREVVRELSASDGGHNGERV